ncbi:MAG: hypothetical protein IPK53_07520 [bacterium]|nr:hypothetical protein [bacterium]
MRLGESLVETAVAFGNTAVSFWRKINHRGALRTDIHLVNHRGQILHQHTAAPDDFRPELSHLRWPNRCPSRPAFPWPQKKSSISTPTRKASSPKLPASFISCAACPEHPQRMNPTKNTVQNGPIFLVFKKTIR